MKGLWSRMAALTLAGVCAGAGAQEGTAINLFDGETLFGWNEIGTADWEVEGGAITCDEGSGGWIATTSQFKDFELTAKVKVKGGSNTVVLVRAGLEGHWTENGSSAILIDEPKNGGDWHEISVKAEGASVTATIDGKEAEVLGGGREKGYIGFAYNHNGENVVEVKDVALRPIALEPIFNGTDLTGWNVLEGHGSIFAVVEGAINIKTPNDANGQIETDKMYKDGILQIDVFSAGQHQNSGVFFRGPKGQFWRGYESQVRNQWEGDDRTKPVDFGTGGNYGNQKTRRVVPNDSEWFTKTIVVDGNHAAVWVNGHLVSDFTDMRPVNKEGNGKAGYLPEAGTYHLQGHQTPNAVSDISFKNILVQEY